VETVKEIQAFLERFSLKGGFVVIGVKEFDTIVSEVFVSDTIKTDVAEHLRQHSKRLKAEHSFTPDKELIKDLLQQQHKERIQ